MREPHRSTGEESASNTGRVYDGVETALRRAVLLGPPLVMAVLAAVHPTEHNQHDSVAALAPVAGDWTALHLALLPAAALVGVGLYSLVAPYRGPAALVARVGIATYAFGATVIDAVNGLAVGLFLTELEEASVDPATVEPVLNGVFGGPVSALVGLLTILGYAAGVLATSVVLRREGAPLTPLVGLVGSTLGVVSHVGLTGVVGWLFLLGAVTWLTFGWRASRQTREPRTTGTRASETD